MNSDYFDASLINIAFYSYTENTLYISLLVVAEVVTTHQMNSINLYVLYKFLSKTYFQINVIEN